MQRLRYGIATGDHVRQGAGPSSHAAAPDGAMPLGSELLRGIHAQARAAWSGNPEWRSGSAKDFIDRFIGSVPDKAVIHTIDTLPPYTPHAASVLELYFLGRFEDLSLPAKEGPDGALTLLSSIQCLGDLIRTKKFLVGVREAVGRLEAEKEGGISVCDAGCGAIPIQSIYAALCSERVHCTALELNPHSARLARMIVEQMGLADRIQVIEADARTYAPERKIDLLVSETMNSGLIKEPLVQIMSNLSRHVTDGGIMLPSKVNVMSALIPMEHIGAPEGYVRINQEDVGYFDAQWNTVAQYVPGAKLDTIQAMFATYWVKPGWYCAFMTSTVRIGSQELGLYQSIITAPQIVRRENSHPEFFFVGGDPGYIRIRYAPGETLHDKATFEPG